MSALAGVGWAIATAVAVVVAYAILSAATLSFVRLPDEPAFSVVEDAILVATAPFVVVVVAGSLLGRRRGR